MLELSDPWEELPVDVFSIIERTCSVFSLLGSVLVIGTFCASKAFHKPINRLVFYASFGNLMTNAATLMARTFVTEPSSPGCQFQGFLIQMFMPADTFWTLAMAVNVYLTFYFKFDGTRLRKMEIPYLFCCYGIPFVVALTFIFIQTPERGKMYGNATLWCWISPRWDIFRIATFYGPIWIVISITFFIYIRAGREIYKKHQQLRDFSTSHHDHGPYTATEDLFSSVKTTEVSVTSEAIDQSLQTLGIAQSGTAEPKAPSAAYSVHISSNRRAHERESYGDMPPSTQPNINIDSQAPSIRNATTAGANPLRRRAAYEANSATWSYAKCSILFFTAMLITWIPSSANRVYSVIHKNQASLTLEYMSAFVLPLQGFWNAVIYVVTSWKACQILWDDTKAWFGHKDQHVVGDGSFQMMSSGRNAFKNNDKTYETESMTELAGSSSHAEDRSPIEPPSKTLDCD